MKHYPYYEDFLVDGIEWPFNVVFTKEHTGDFVIFRGYVDIADHRLGVSYYVGKKSYYSAAVDFCDQAEATILEKLRSSIKQWYNSSEGTNK